MEPAYLADNRRERERLQRVAETLSDEDLAADLGGGWTVATALGHLAFWDHRAAVLLARWREKGVAPSPVDADAVNDALLPLLRAIPARQAARLAVAAAERADREVEAFPESMVEQAQALGSSFRLRRAIHREEHLAQIEAALRRGER